MSRFTDKVVIVTGSSNGIGRGTALLFAKEGAKVTITGRNAERLEETIQQIVKAGVPEDNVNIIVGDLTTESTQDDLVNSTIKKFGKLDILVNNAGAMFPDSKGNIGIDTNIKSYDKILDLNLRCIVELTKKARPHLTASKGEIINVSSTGGCPVAHVEFMYYAMTQAALDQFTKSTAIQLIPKGIRVNSMSPGVVQTGFGELMGMPQENMNKILNFMASHKECIPAGYFAQPEYIANLIAFLADRKASSYIIGQTIIADGGSSLIMGMSAHDMNEILSQ